VLRWGRHDVEIGEYLLGPPSIRRGEGREEGEGGGNMKRQASRGEQERFHGGAILRH